VAVAMVNTAAKVEHEFQGTLKLAAGGFKSVTRISSSPYGMWHDIFLTNKQATTEVLQKFIDELNLMKEKLQCDGLQSAFDSAATTRRELPANSKGFMGALHEIVVTAEDRPGFIAKITSLLAEAEINIRDIELLKVREGEAGTFMLAFSSQDEAKQAITLLESNNFTARSR